MFLFPKAGALVQHTRVNQSAQRLETSLPPPKISVDVWTDVACPWCYVGKKRLDRAINLMQARNPQANIEVNWHPFIMDPKIAPQGAEYTSYTEARWGSDEWTKELRRSGAPDGAAFSNWRSWPNTQQAHELIARAAEEDKASQACELLFRRTYEQGGNVSLLHELEAIGASLGLADAGSHLRAGTYRSLVSEEDKAAKKELNITGVPYVIVGGPGSNSYALSGAQRPERLLAVFELVISKARESAIARLQQQTVMAAQQQKQKQQGGALQPTPSASSA